MLQLNEGLFVHLDCEITVSAFGRDVEMCRGSRIAVSQIGDDSYCNRLADFVNAEVGKFVNVAS